MHLIRYNLKYKAAKKIIQIKEMSHANNTKYHKES